MPAFFSFKKRPVPIVVPVVPIAATKWVRRPPVCGPDLRAGRLPVRLRIGGVAVLVGIEVRLGRRLGQLQRLARRAFGAVQPVGHHHLGAVDPEQRPALGARIAGQADGHLHARRRAEHGVGDAGVAAGGIQQPLPGQLARGPALRAEWPVRARSLTLPPGLSHSALSQSRPRPSPGNRTGRRGVFPTRLHSAGSCETDGSRTAVIATLQNEKPDRPVGLQHTRTRARLTRR